MKYLEWNNIISAYFFNPVNAGKDIHLYLTKNDIVGLARQNFNEEIRKQYLINAYRVLLTRARQGMVIVVPEGNIEDHTRQPEFYDKTFNYLKSIGFKTI